MGGGLGKELTRFEILEKMSHLGRKCGDPPCGRGIRTRSRCRADDYFQIFLDLHTLVWTFGYQLFVLSDLVEDLTDKKLELQ